MRLADTLLVFARYPAPGTVKTRLVPPLSPGQAAEVQTALIHAMVGWVTGWGGALRWVVTPDDRAAAFAQTVGCDAIVWPQGEGDLGARLERATCRAFDEGAGCVLLMGTDSPTLPVGTLAAAVDALQSADAVLGPCDDGGYYLLGMNTPQPALFADISWGGPDVADQTRRRAAACGLRWSELPCSYDLDRIDDLRRAVRELSLLSAPNATAARSLAAGLGKILAEATEQP